MRTGSNLYSSFSLTLSHFGCKRAVLSATPDQFRFKLSQYFAAGCSGPRGAARQQLRGTS